MNPPISYRYTIFVLWGIHFYDITPILALLRYYKEKTWRMPSLSCSYSGSKIHINLAKTNSITLIITTHNIVPKLRNNKHNTKKAIVTAE